MTRKIKINSAGNPISRLDIARKNKIELAKKTRKGGKVINRSLIRKLAKISMVFIVVGLIGMLGASVAAFSWLQDLNDELPTPDEVFADPPIPSTVFDRNGQQLYKVIGDFNSELVDINNVPEHVKWAFLASEDVDFYNHTGFDTAGILYCGFRIAGGDFCGASTITQQLIKMTALRDEENRVVRKIKELFMATKVEQNSEKDEILQMYLSVAPFGSNTVGLESAAKFYYRKDPKDLTLAEAAILAAMIQNPAYMSPTKPFDGDTEAAQARVKARQEDHVLYQLEQKLDRINAQIETNARDKAQSKGEEFNPDSVQRITLEQIQAAKEETLSYAAPVATNKLAGHFVDYALLNLQSKNYKAGEEPFTLAELQNNGYKIYTTLDYELQKIAEEYARRGGEEYKVYNVYNAALLTLQPSTGQIITMAGSRSFYGEREACDANGQNCKYDPEVNVITSRQSPGSTNKSLGYYLAYEQGKLYPGSHLPDFPISIGGYVPKNWDSQNNGINKTAEFQLRASRNIPALEVMEMVGVQNYIEKARQFGITTYEDPSQLGHSLILGGGDVIPLEHAASYGVFATQGDYLSPESILKIEDRDGKVIYEHSPKPERVGSPQAAYLLNQTLYNLDPGSGPYRYTSWDGRDVAAKTGTTEENKDAFLLMYSPDFVTLAWSGNNNNEPLNTLYGWPGIITAPWTVEYMSQIGNASYFANKTPFSRPAYVTTGGGGCNANGCVGIQPGWMIEGIQYPIDYINEKAWVCNADPTKKAKQIHIDLGMATERTFQKFVLRASAWQGMFDEWMRSKGTPNGAPTEECNIDPSGGEAGPFFGITSPVAGATYTDTIQVTGSIFTTAGQIATANVYLNGQLLGAIDNASQINLAFNISGLGLDEGTYWFRIDAEDTNGISDSFEQQIIIGGPISNDFTFTVPATGIVGTPFNVRVQYSGAFTNLTLYAIAEGGQPIEAGTRANFNNIHNFSWTATTPGVYSFYVVGTTATGAIIQSSGSSSITVN